MLLCFFMNASLLISTGVSITSPLSDISLSNWDPGWSTNQTCSISGLSELGIPSHGACPCMPCGTLLGSSWNHVEAELKGLAELGGIIQRTTSDSLVLGA